MASSQDVKNRETNTENTPFDGSNGRANPATAGDPIETSVMHGGAGGNKRDPQKSRTARYWPLALLGVLLVGGALWRANSNSAGGSGGSGAGGPGGDRNREPDITTVPVVPVSVGTITQTLIVTGSLKSNQNVDLNSKISGRVARVLVDEGQRVVRGQLLVELDDEDLRAAVAQAQANVRAAQVRLQQTILGLPARESQVLTSIQQAQANLATAEARYRAAILTEPVRAQTSQAGVENARAGIRTAQARLRQAQETQRSVEQTTQQEVRRAQSGIASARAQLAEVERGARDQQIAQAQAQVSVAQANLNDAQTELNRQRQLFEGGAVARAAVDAAQTRFDITRAQLEQAQQNLSLVREGATTEQVRQAQEAVRQAESQLATAQTGRSTRIPIARNDVISARAALYQAEETLRTAQANLAQVPITRQETRVAKEAVEQARASLAQARANRSQIPVAREDVNSSRAAVQQAQAALQQAQVNLNYARIFSPVNGVVNTKLTDVGETASPGAALMNLVSLDRVYFEALVSENNVSRVKVGQPANITIAALGNRKVRGFVSDVIPTADPRLRQFRLRITIPGSSQTLTPGSFARGTVDTATVYNALTVPEEAVKLDGNRPHVFLASGEGKDMQVKRRNVAVGISNGGRTQIIGGVQRGDRVIITDELLDDGEKVRAAKTA